MSQLAVGEVACFWLDRARDADWLVEEAAAAGLATAGSPDSSDRARLTEQALRLALARAGETAASAATIVTAPRGRPSFADSEIEFSLSHSGTVTVLAIGKVRRLGVDLELGRRPLMIA